MNKMYDENTRWEDIPAEAFKFEAAGQVMFAEGEDKNKIQLMLYDGSVAVGPWYWGNMAFELSSMRLEKKRIGILDSHDTNKRLGFSTGATFEDKFTLEGKLLSNQDAQRIKSDAAEGFPFEASMRFESAKAKIEFIKEGQQTEINGRVLKGPGTVIRNTIIKEGSVCVFGAMNNCKTKIFEQENKAMGKEEDKKDAMTAEKFEKEYPEIFAEVVKTAKEEGAKGVREEFA